jgi:uncharacterized membrane protein
MGITVIQILLTVVAPILILIYQKNKIINFLSPVVACYALGIIIANIPGLNLNVEVSKMATEAAVPLAIPLLLFGTDFIRWFRLAKSTVISFILIVVTVCIVSATVSLGFKDVLENYWQIAGMLVGVYTGGTPNMTAIGMGLGVEENVFILMNGADLLMGASYLLFILTIGIRLIGKFLPEFKSSGNNDHEDVMTCWDGIDNAKKIKNSILLILMSGAVLGISLGLNAVLFDKDQVAFIILVITTLGIAASFNTQIRKFKGSYEVGQYLLLVFCVGIGSMANINELLNGSWVYVVFLGTVMLLSITIHIILCKFFKIDRDTAIITSVAGIFGPPFVGPVAEQLKNREIVVSGLTSGLVGYAVGNYLGIAVAYLVKGL